MNSYNYLDFLILNNKKLKFIVFVLTVVTFGLKQYFE